MGFLSLLAQWALQGVVIFATGLLPLFITSQSLLASLTTFGTGRLIGSSLATFFSSVSLGAASTLSVPGVSALPFSPAALAISHIAGILFMLVAERRLSSRMLDASPPAGLDSDTPPSPAVAAQDATELRERQQTEDMGDQLPPASRMTRAFGPHQRRVYLFIFAFVVGEIAAGIRFGYGATAPPWRPDNASSGRTMPSLPGPVTIYLLGLTGEVVTTLGFATTLLSASLPIAECKRDVLLYAAARPLAALLSYSVTILSRITPTNKLPAMIVTNSFAGGLFVYAALVVRTLIANSRTTARSGLLARVFLMAAGALLPYMLPMLVMIGHMLWYNPGKLSRDTVEVSSSTAAWNTSS